MVFRLPCNNFSLFRGLQVQPCYCCLTVLHYGMLICVCGIYVNVRIRHIIQIIIVKLHFLKQNVVFYELKLEIL